MARKNKQTIPSLPEAELDVLSCVLQRGQVTAREIREALVEARPMAHASVVTLLTRLEAKGLLRKEKAAQGKAFVYEATAKPSTVYRSLVGGMLNRVFGGNGLAMALSLFETQPPNAEELDKLQTLLDDMRAKEIRGRDS